jgi:hypothetical protein
MFITSQLAYTDKHDFVVYGAAFVSCFALRNSLRAVCEMSLLSPTYWLSLPR